MKSKSNTLNGFTDLNDIFVRYLKVAPLSLALFRTAEAARFQQLPLKRPVLDLGCGFGEFSGVFFKSKLEVGIDISIRDLIRAQKSNKYKKLVWVDAKEMPFPENTYNTVISVSVLEHISDVKPVLTEVCRVLKPQGLFVFTVNLESMSQHLFWPNVLKKIKLDHLADQYVDLFHRVFKHKTLLSKEQWRQLLTESGFEIIESETFMGRKIMRIFDLFLITAFSSEVVKRFIKKRWVLRPQFMYKYLSKHYIKIIESDSGEGSVLYVAARKK